MQIIKGLRKIHWLLLAGPFFLSLAGLLSIFGSGLASGNFTDFYKQAVFLIIAVFLAIFVSFFDLRALKANSRLVLALYSIGTLSLVGLFFFGSRIRGVMGWYKLGFISIDPVPFVAMILIIILAKYFSTRHKELKNISPIFLSGIYMSIPALLVLKQPDLGSAIILVAIWLGMIIFSGIRLRHLVAIILIFLILFGLGWQFWLQDYHKQRIKSFFNPEMDKQGISWNVNQSKIAIGSGGLLGKGLAKGSQTQYNFLPETKTDFIFSAIAEEFGFLGVFLFLTVFLFFFWQIIKVALLAEDNFTRLFAQGFAVLILAQSFINIGMCLGLFPVVGVPLPFVSYGGSHLLGFYFGLGILLSLSKK